MCIACSPGVAALAPGASANLSVSAFAPPGGISESVEGPPAAEPERAVILRGGPILTVDDADSVVEALAIRGSTILEMGSLTEIKRHYTSATEIVDLEGRAVLPGFVEPHVHLLASALAAAGIPRESAARLLRDEPDRIVQIAADTLRGLARRGCTTVYDTGIGLLAGVAEHELLRALARAPDAPLRVRGAFTPELATSLGATPGFGDERYDVVGIAYWADGPIEECAAALDEPYLNGRGSGELVHEEAQLREAMRAWHRAGWQLVAHANGDRAVGQVLRCYEAILGMGGPSVANHAMSGIRHRIEHVTLAREEQVARAAALGVAVSHTINQVYCLGQTLRDEVLGAERAACVHALRRELEQDLASSCHSCSPAYPVDPCLALRTATTRLMRDSEDVLGPFQQLTLREALRTVTCNAADHVLLGHHVGSLRPGMFADLVVLDRDPRAVSPERLHELRVLETWLGGRRQRWA
jgi:predicted amidohydrolase YtcJ